jgi:hypothetical protein
MAGKEATVYILDLGRSMGEKRHGRDQTDLDWALEYVWDKITTTVSRRSFGDLVRQLLECFDCLQDETLVEEDANVGAGWDRQENRAHGRDRVSHR